MAVFVAVAVGVDEHADERGSRGEAQSRKWAMYRVTKFDFSIRAIYKNATFVLMSAQP